MAITLLRHTQPEVATGVCYGRTDLDVAASFPAEANRAEQQLPVISSLLTSPARRCRLLAEHIGRARGLPVIEEPRLRELDFGRWEGQFWDAIPSTELAAWGADILHANPYQGETVAQLTARVRELLAAGTAGHGHVSGHVSGHVLWVTHAGVIKAAANLLQHDSAMAANQPTGNFDWTLSVKFGEMLSFPHLSSPFPQSAGDKEPAGE